MKKRSSAWSTVVFFVLLAALFGLAVTLDIVRKEGWEGFWNRKRTILESTHPESGPLVDEAEKRTKGVTPL